MTAHPIRLKLALDRAHSLMDFGALAVGEIPPSASPQVRALYAEAATAARNGGMAVLTGLQAGGDPTQALADLGAAEQRLLDNLREIDRLALAGPGAGG